MKKTLFLLLFGAFLGNTAVKAQTSTADPIVLEIGDEKITQSEFMKSFGQANMLTSDATAAEKQKALNEYVDLFVNFRLKIKDAIAEKYDTSSAFQREYNTYRNEVAAPYLIDSDRLEKILHEVYQRNQQAVRASHIMVALPRTPTPDDTLKAYNRAMEIYNKAIVPGADFKRLAIAFSEDPSAKDHLSRQTNTEVKGNGGDLGYFTVFDMVYPFEEAAFNLEIGEISKPVRSEYGYHIVKLFDKISIYGKSSIQHIWVGSLNEKDDARMLSRINDAYRRLQLGEDFNDVVRNCSEDRSTVPVNGLMENVPIQRMVPEYVKEISKLKVGEYSKPFKTQYGWHIIKLVKKDTIPSFDDMRSFYKQRISRDQRSKQPQDVFVENMKKKYVFEDYFNVNKVAFDELRSYITDSVFKKAWVAPELKHGNTTAFVIGDKSYTVAEFSQYIYKTQKQARPRRQMLDAYYSEVYANFVGDKIVEYANSRLEKDYPDFDDIVKEYRNGLLIFAYNDAKVWSKAILDTAGLKEFYDRECVKRDINDPQQAIYFWGERADVTTMSVIDSNCIDINKVLKIAKKNVLKEGLDRTKITELMMKKVNKKKCSMAKPVFVRNVLVEKDDDQILKPDQFQRGIYTSKTSDGEGYIVLVVKGMKEPCLKSLREARGYYINDYQNYLEAQLIESLKAKYKVVVHQDKIDAITF